METRQYISEELFNKMQEAVNTNAEQFQYSYSDICVLLVNLNLCIYLSQLKKYLEF